MQISDCSKTSEEISVYNNCAKPKLRHHNNKSAYIKTVSPNKVTYISETDTS